MSRCTKGPLLSEGQIGAEKLTACLGEKRDPPIGSEKQPFIFLRYPYRGLHCRGGINIFLYWLVVVSVYVNDPAPTSGLLHRVFLAKETMPWLPTSSQTPDTASSCETRFSFGNHVLTITNVHVCI